MGGEKLSGGKVVVVIIGLWWCCCCCPPLRKERAEVGSFSSNSLLFLVIALFTSSELNGKLRFSNDGNNGYPFFKIKILVLIKTKNKRK